MRLHLLLLALALGCATEDAKTDDTSSNGGSGDGDGGNLLSQVAGMVTEMAEMSAKIAAQQATIAQLEMQMAETLRWETVEVTCSEEAVYKDVGLSSVGAVNGTAWGKSSDTTAYWTPRPKNPKLNDDGTITVFCGWEGTAQTTNPFQKYWLVTVGYER